VKTNNTEDHPGCYDNLSLEEKRALDNWICSKFQKAKRIYRRRSSYGLKHDFERDSGIYVYNGAFKGAMLAAGFAPADETEQNWHFRVKEKVPDSFYGWCVQRYKHRNSALGDLARDMEMMPSFPKLSTDKDEILEHLWQSNACNGAIRAFERAWKQYERFNGRDGQG